MEGGPSNDKATSVKVDVPKYLVKLGMSKDASKLDRAMCNLTMIAFYYLLRIGEYATKGVRDNSKQTQEFKMGDITLFKKDTGGNLRCLPWDAPDKFIQTADGTTMKLDNQKNGWKGICVYQEPNGDPLHSPVWALG